jgi:hypothetical protein
MCLTNRVMTRLGSDKISDSLRNSESGMTGRSKFHDQFTLLSSIAIRAGCNMDRRSSAGLQDEQRLQDYLDDQLREAGDLEGIERLLARVGEQQSLLQSQV